MTTIAAGKRRNATFRAPIYSGRVTICLTRDSYTRARKALGVGEVRDIDHTYGLCGRHMDEKKKESVYLVGWFDNRLSTLTHELVHLTFEMLTYSGIPISKKNDEAFAYLMDALLDACLEATGTTVLRRRKPGHADA